MSNRSWFYASEGQQKGPFPEGQLLDLIARGPCDRIRWSGPREWRAGKKRQKFLD